MRNLHMFVFVCVHVCASEEPGPERILIACQYKLIEESIGKEEEDEQREESESASP